MLIFEVAAYAILGAVVGSFLNVCIDRLPGGKSLIRPPSHCPACGYRLKPVDLIPVVSYLMLRGKCRVCSFSIPRRVIAVEVVTGFLFAFLIWWFNPGVNLAIAILFTCLLLVIAVIDIEYSLILNILTYPGILIALMCSFLRPEIGITGSIIGLFSGLVTIVIIIYASRGGMGIGDAKMAALVGAILGFPMVFLALLVAVVTGGIVAVILIAAKLKGRKDRIPFGPFLAWGGWLALVFGKDILSWYLGVS
jgi:leader peptidase (prepilin peptidase)/N-methyltransferase